jgi:hypothetical protein
MALVDLTKQLAKEALGNQVKEILDPEKAPAAQPEKMHAVILGQIQAMQKALKEDQELVVLLNGAAGTIRVLEIYVPSPQVFVLTGVDGEKNVTRVISPVESTQLVCKVMKVAAGQAAKVGIVVPKGT